MTEIDFLYVIIIGIVLFISISVNLVLLLYIKNVLLRVYAASNQLSEIFTVMDSYREHLKSIYELPTFYGDDTLTGLLTHTKAVFSYLEKYEEVYSFTNPDLLEQLDAASMELEKNYEDQEEAS